MSILVAASPDPLSTRTVASSTVSKRHARTRPSRLRIARYNADLQAPQGSGTYNTDLYNGNTGGGSGNLPPLAAR